VAVGGVLTTLTGALISETHGHFDLLAILLVLVLAGLASAAWVTAIDRREQLSHG